MHDDTVDDGEPVAPLLSPHIDQKPITIKIPAMARSVTDMSNGLRRSTRSQNRKHSDSFTQPSGSEYSASSSIASDDKNMEDAEGEDDPGDEEEHVVESYTTSRGRATRRLKSYAESDSDDVRDLFNDDENVTVVRNTRTTRSAKPRGKQIISDDDDEASVVNTYTTRSRAKKTSGGKENGAASVSPLVTSSTIHPPPPPLHHTSLARPFDPCYDSSS